MPDQNDTQETLLTLTADIVAAHVSNNSVAVNDLPTLIQNVHAALSGISGSVPAPEAAVITRALGQPPWLALGGRTMLAIILRVLRITALPAPALAACPAAPIANHARAATRGSTYRSTSASGLTPGSGK